MGFFRELTDQARRTTVDIMHGAEIEKDCPFSPEVPDDLRSWLPDLFDRYPIVLPWSKSKPIDPALHNIWLLDNTAFRSPSSEDKRPELQDLKGSHDTHPTNPDGAAVRSGSGWEVEFVAAYFIKNSGEDLAGVAGAVIKALNINDDDTATKDRISKRLQNFTDAVLPNRTVRVSIGGKEEQTLGPSNMSGISTGLHGLHFQPRVEVLQSNALNLPPPFGLPCTTVFAEEQGWGVISDIDDTIKVTQTTDAIGILENTFTVENPEPIAGTPDLYTKIKSLLNDPTFFYLSASPYNLYPFLRQFRDTHFPHGTMILRDASWQNLGGLITSLQAGTTDYKNDRITKIHSWFPHRRFVCIGDSTQSDPESYGDMARKYPGWIRAIFIRKATGIAGMSEEKNQPERFEKAFRELDPRLWYVFTDPAELAERVEELSRHPDALVGGEHFG
ncbi:hypothetical protein NU195Hw_g6242t1 [Hortaea werneckii]